MFHRSPALVFACLALVLGGCSSAFSEQSADMVPFNTGDAGASNDATPGPAYDVAADAGLAPSLCGAGACSPDEGTSDKALAVQCMSPMVPDAGKYADASTSGPACRLASNGKAVVAACGTAGLGQDGDACTVGADCAAGFECVSSPGRCRHYCCDPTACKAVGTSQTNDTTYFCDVQNQANSNVKVPACLPVQACKLLVANSCAVDQTCSIVDVLAGTRSCVQVGPAKVGESCETTHCGADLVCLGSPGKRSCQQLCDPTQTGVCPNGQLCKQPWQVLKMDGAGICQP